MLSLPHSGTAIPATEHPLYAADLERLVLLGDLYVDLLYQAAASLGICVVRTPYSRFLVDLNRLPDDLSPASAEGAKSRKANGYHGTRGVLWSVTPSGEPMYLHPLTTEHVEARLRTYYYPYHQALSQHLRRLRDRFGYAILIDGHSMPSMSVGLRPQPRPHIIPGDLLGQSCAPALRNFVEDYWRGCGRTVQSNRPYQGGAITRTHGAPADGIHAIQIEISRALYMDERTFQLNRTFTRTRQECTAFLEALSSLNLARIRAV